MITALERFALAVLEESRESLADLGGGWLQDTAVELGVLIAVGWPIKCYRYSPEVAAAITECAAAQMTGQATAGPDDLSEPPTSAPPAPIDPESQLYRSLLKKGGGFSTSTEAT